MTLFARIVKGCLTRITPPTLSERIVFTLALGALAITAVIGVGASYLVMRERLISEAFAFGVEMREFVATAEQQIISHNPVHVFRSGAQIIWYPEGRSLGGAFGRPAQFIPLPEKRNDPFWPQELSVYLQEGSLSQEVRDSLFRTENLSIYLGTLSREIMRLGTQAQLELTLSDGSRLRITHPRLWSDRWRPASVFVLFVLTSLVVAGSLDSIARALANPFSSLASHIDAEVDKAEITPASETDGPVEARAMAAAYNRLRTRIARMITERTQMLAAISHDLRTPGTRLRLRAEFVEDDELRESILSDLDEMDSLVSESMDLLGEGVRREAEKVIDFESLLQSICDDYADLGRPVEFIEPPSLQFRPVQSLFGTHEDSYQAFGGRRVVRLLCRPTALRRAFTNLIDNALKYGNVARVSMDATADSILIEIDDDGPGIPEEEMENVFLPFYRLETSRARSTGGSGLGLATVKSIIETHGGEVTLANRPEGGLKVIVSLPRG